MVGLAQLHFVVCFYQNLYSDLTMTTTAHISPPPDITVGKTRVLRVTGLRDGGYATVVLDNAGRLVVCRRGNEEFFHLPWDVQQALHQSVLEDDE